MEAAQGIVEKIHTNKAGFYNCVIDGSWYGCGKDRPSFSEGDYINFTFTRRGNFMNMDMNSVQKKEGSVQQSPSIANAAKSAGGAGSSKEYWENKEARDANVQAAIHWQSSRSNAIAAVQAMVQAEVVKMPSAQGKKYDVFMSLVDEVTERYFADTNYVYENREGPTAAQYETEEEDQEEAA